MRKICVVGLGYIGLPTAALLAGRGHEVLGTDVDPRVVEAVNRGRIHIVEPDLEASVRAAAASGRLTAGATPRAADVYMICVPTPFHEGSGIPRPNIDHVMAATRSVAGLARAGDLVILESTSPVGTTRLVADELRRGGADVDAIHIAYCPERVLPGRILTELVENDRVVGGLTPESAAAVAAFYRGFVRGQVFETDAACAEMCKLAENSFRDVNIAFANELSMLCERSGIDVRELIRLANRHPRVNILQPGTGVGGHCIAVDPWFIVAGDPETARLIRTAREVNNEKARWVVERVRSRAEEWTAERRTPPKIVCLGLAFKPDIDDLRESPAVEVAEALKARGYDVVAVEPNIAAHDTLPLLSLDDALREDALFAVLVKHRPFLEPDVVETLKKRRALDFCGAVV